MNGVEREFMPFMSPWALPLLYLLTFITFSIMFWGFYLLIKNYKIQIKAYFVELAKLIKQSPGDAAKLFFRQIIGQQKVIRFKIPGIMHICIFFGMVVLFIGTFIIFVDQDILKPLGFSTILQGNFYLAFEFLLDLFGLVLLLGLLIAITRRIIFRPTYLRNTPTHYVILFSLLFIVVSGFLLEAIRLTLQPVDYAYFSFVGYFISQVLTGIGLSNELMASSYQAIWWSHVVIALALIASVPFTMLKHLVLIPLSLPLVENRPPAKLTTPFKIAELAEEPELDIIVGLSKESDYNWKQKMHHAACVDCGRCESRCPAYASGRELSPKELIQSINKQFGQSRVVEFNEDEDFFERGVLTENQVWSCTNCGACVAECPAMLNHVDYIIDYRRHLLAINRCDEQKTSVLAKIDQNFNPYGVPSYKKSEWLAELEVPTLQDNPDAELLYWIGCAGSIDPRVRNVVTSMLGLMEASSLNYAILGDEEKCCGEVPKRFGEEGRFQLIAEENMQILNYYGIKKIVTHCPHCYNTLKHEYPEFNGNYQVLHHTELINQLIQTGNIKFNLKPLEQKIVYHDPCNLSRLNGITDEPRKILGQLSIDPLQEASYAKEETFCCGGGGGNYWYKVPEKERISCLRLNQLSAGQANAIAVACPYCMAMFEDNIRTLGIDDLQVKDVAELVFENYSLCSEKRGESPVVKENNSDLG